MRSLTCLIVSLCLWLMSPSLLATPTWAHIENLAQQGKLADIQKQIPPIIEQAKQRKDNKAWREALLLHASASLGQYNREAAAAINALSNQTWPTDPDSALLLNLHLAHYLQSYLQNNRWEIQIREEIKSQKAIPLEKQTMGQLSQRMHDAFTKAYRLASQRNETVTQLSKLPLKRLGEYFTTESSYPKQVRGTLRDTVAYLWANTLKDSSYWAPDQHSELRNILTPKLLAVPYKENVNPYDIKQHPLKRAVKILSDLAQHQLARRNTDGSLEAFRVKLNIISAIKRSETDKKQIQHALRLRIKQQENAKQNTPWLNRLHLELAYQLQHRDTPDALIHSLNAVKPCLTDNSLPQLLAQCQQLADDITAPSLQMQLSTLDGLGKRSIKLSHKNIDEVYFQAWKIDPKEAARQPSHQRSAFFLDQKIRQSTKPDAAWQAPLEKTKNYRIHDSYITPPMNEEGLWLVAISKTDNFTKMPIKGHQVFSSIFNLSKLSADIRYIDNTLSVTAYNGETGRIQPNVTVELWKTNNSSPTQRATTNAQGLATLRAVQRNQYSLLLTHQGKTALIDNVNTYRRSNLHEPTNSSLIFTDRSIYRPNQTINWKVVAYYGNPNVSQYKVEPNTTGWVRLLDANGKEVQRSTVTTNQFGSASGEFTVKAGLLLGQWRIDTQWGGNKYIKVEEYKRPTFKANIEQPKQALRLNQAATITGAAEYYFGGAVTDGKVTWRVTRNPSYTRNNRVSAKNIANGTAKLDKKGEFSIRFTPDSLPNQSPDNITPLNYTISVDITDSGGETRNASRSFTIGNTTIQASINSHSAFATAGKPFKLTISRQDLNNTGRAGAGFWSLHPTQQPSDIKMPSQLPVTTIQKAALPFATAGDKQQPRWANYQGIAAYTKDWRDAGKIAQNSIRHPDSGDVEVTLTAPKAGLYRLHYSTKDKWGQLIKVSKLIVVSNQQQTNAQLPAYLETATQSVEVGQQVSLLAGTGFASANSVLEVFHGNTLVKRSVLTGGIKPQRFAVTAEHRGGLTFVLTTLKDYQLIRQQKYVSVPWTDRELNVSFSTFRDKLQPGQKEKWRVSVKDAKNRPLEQGAAEVLASMFDRSLELFGTHSYPSVNGLYRSKQTNISRYTSFGSKYADTYMNQPYPRRSITRYSDTALNLTVNIFSDVNCHPHPYDSTSQADRHCHKESTPSFDRGIRPQMVALAAPSMAMAKPRLATVAKRAAPKPAPVVNAVADKTSASNVAAQEADSDIALSNIETRTNFNEVAFFKPHLLLEKDGTVTFEFEVPESLTQWKVWVSALTRDLRGGSTTALSRTSKELMVRPYLPRFLRTGDQANIEVLVNNGSDKVMSGKMSFDIIDPATDKTIASTFKLNPQPRTFNVQTGQSTRLRYSIVTPKDLGMVTIRAKASASNGAQNFGDGEQRPLPVLPSRIHLAQSRFAAMQGNTQRTVQFSELAKNDDATRINDRLVVTVDGQLFYSTLKALPYLTQYPYECTEQTMNRFLSTGIINQTFAQSPALRTMARSFANRGTKLEQWDAINKDPNNRILLEETPWLRQAAGGKTDNELLNILNPSIALAQQKSALAKLVKAQNSDGGFPWWDGGRSSHYMTSYLLQSFAKANEFNIPVPKTNVQRAWKYLHNHYLNTLKPAIVKKRPDVYSLTALSYLLSSYPDNSWTQGVFTAADKQAILNLAFADWLKLPPMLKAQLALSMKRAGRTKEAKLIFDSVMNSALTDKDKGTYWPQQSRSWLWYNDRIDTHAFMLRTMMEITPQDERRHGLVQWLMLNKKLNHWKSTRATAESIYALVHYMKKEGQLDQPERMSVKVGNTLQKDFIFKPTEYTGGKQQLVVKDKNITPDMATIKLDNQSKSLMFASATWHFSTEKSPTSAQGDFFGVTRQFFKRIQVNNAWTLQPLAEGATIKVGDQLEVQLVLRSKYNAEYVHLRAPRGAGFEPMETESGYRWQGGTGFYQEVRDSGMNYFFDSLRTGQYTFKYRVRATTSGKFSVAPAQVQSVYAPEFNAYSSGARLVIQ